MYIIFNFHIIHSHFMQYRCIVLTCVFADVMITLSCIIKLSIFKVVWRILLFFLTDVFVCFFFSWIFYACLIIDKDYMLILYLDLFLLWIFPTAALKSVNCFLVFWICFYFMKYAILDLFCFHDLVVSWSMYNHVCFGSVFCPKEWAPDVQMFF